MKTFKSIIALFMMVFIPFGFMLWYRNHHSTGFATIELILYPLLFGGSSILLLYAIKKHFLKEELSDFNSGKGSIAKDILWGFMLTLSNILTFKSNHELLHLMLDMRKSPLLLILWFGPVLWIGIALYEELIRVFMLTSFWKFSNNTYWIIFSILITAIIIGLAHWSQGSYGVVTIAIKSLVSGYFFYKIRRILPLVIAHVLYDGIQVALLLITYPQ